MTSESFVDGIADAFTAFIDRYGRFFLTKTRDGAAVARRDLRGLAPPEDCSFVVTVFDDSCTPQFQHFIGNSPSDCQPVLAQIGQDGDRLLGGKPSSCLIIEESSFANQGDRSLGVSRQWSGPWARSTTARSRCSGCLAMTRVGHP